MSRPAAPVRLALAALAATTFAACAKPKPVHLGDDQAIAPQLAVIDSERPPRTYDVTLAEPAHVAILAVFPGRGVTLVYPRDTTAPSASLPAGAHRLRADSVRAPASLDSALLRRLPTARDSARTRADSARLARNNERIREMERDPRMSFGAEHAHLMLFAAREPINYGALARRVQGVTIPIGPSEALSTVAKMARAATSAVRWAATAIEVELRR